MGDLDVTQMMMPVQELEDLMSDALNEVDEELSRLFTCMSFLSEHCSRITSEISTLRKYHRCFMALNLFVVPIIIAIGIAYGSIGLVELNPTLEEGLQMIITLLMYVSGGIGLPLYVFTLWGSCVAGYGQKGICKSGAKNTRKENESISHVMDFRNFSMADFQESFETISEFRTFASRNRIIRQLSLTEEASQHEIYSSPPEEVKDATVETSIDSEEREVMMEHNKTNTSEELDSDDLSRKCAHLITDEIRNESPFAIEALQKGETHLFDDVQLDLADPSEEFMKGERNVKNTPEIEKESFSDVSQLQLTTPLRDLPIENVGEDDCTVLQANTNIDIKHNRSEQAFGL